MYISRMRRGFAAVGIGLLINAAGGAQVQNPPPATDNHGGFGLPDQRGRRLLVIPSLAHPERLKFALCNGRRVPVEFQRLQVEGANRDGRQTSRSFDTLAGSVFAVLGNNSVDP